MSKFKSTDAPSMKEGRPIAPQPPKKFEPMADQVDDVKEVGGRKDGPSPTRYGDWEKGGRCVDF